MDHEYPERPPGVQSQSNAARRDARKRWRSAGTVRKFPGGQRGVTAAERRRELRQRARARVVLETEILALQEDLAREEAAEKYARALVVEEDNYHFFAEEQAYQLFYHYESVPVYHPYFYPWPVYLIYQVFHH